MNFGIVGCGKMATAVALSLHSTNKNFKFHTYSASYDSAKILADQISGLAFESIKDLKDVDYILIGCKPQQFKSLAHDLVKNLDLKEMTIISIMAAISTQKIQSLLNVKKVIRLMPNMPISINKGISLFYFSKDISKISADSFVALFNNSSKNFVMNSEGQFNKVTTISSCGPAYIYYMMSAFSKKLQDFSLSEKDSRLLVSSLFEGSALMTNEFEDSLETMIGAVTSKAGVTIEAINTFNDLKLTSLIDKGINRAYNRSCEIEDSI